MKIWIMLVVLFYSGSIFSRVIKGYQYPFVKPYMATTLAALGGSNIPDFNYEKILVGDYLERQALIKNYPSGNLGLLIHTGKRRPLVFVLGGFGANIYEGNVKLLAYHLHFKLGYHVIAMPDQFYWYNALITDKDLVLGDFPSDIKGFSSIMKKALKKVQDRGVKFSDISISGYSIGGLRSLFIAQQDKIDGFFNFKTVVAINPPLSVFEAGKVIGKAYSLWKTYTKKQQGILINRGYNFAFSVQEQLGKEGSDLLKFISEKFPYKENHSQAMIGYTFLTKFTRYLEATEQINKTGAFANIKEAFPYKLGVIFDYKVNFSQYFSSTLYPFYQKKQNNLSVEDFLHRSSLHSLKSFLQKSSNVFIQHNQDDIILLNTQKDVKFLESLMTENIFLYPHGGHLGNMWFPTNIKHFLSFFSK